MTTLSLDAVRGLMIAAQGLDDAPRPPSTKADVRAAIRRMHALQIDTINIVARSQYLVLWSRLGDYDPRWLDELLEEGTLFEYWSHAASILPIEDYPLYQLSNWPESSSRKWLADNPAIGEAVLNYVREKGETRAADFERKDGQKTGWFNWKEEKVALESLFHTRALMVRKRDNFQRVFDLRERVLANPDPVPELTAAEIHDQFVLYTIQALGVTKGEWIWDYFRIGKTEIKAAIKRLEDQGKLTTVNVEGWKAPAYIDPARLSQAEAAMQGDIPRSRTTFLSPFDPLVWDRARALGVFGFDYKIEIYIPEAKRKYGYFTLPILYNNALIGRLDPKAHRKEGLFEVKSLHLEPGVTVDDAMAAALRQVLKDCAAWHGTPAVVVRAASAPGLAERLSD